MPAYVIADVRDAWDADALDEYRRRNTDAVANHGGRFLVRGGEQSCSRASGTRGGSSSWSSPTGGRGPRVVDSDEYEAIKELRRGASTTNIMLVDGVSHAVA